MCVSNNAIELQAYHFFKKIHESNAYNIVRVDFIDGTFLECDHEKSLRAEVQGIENLPLIKKLILQTKAGEKYSVEPDELGLQFANGNLTYSQYLLAKKQQSRNMLGYTFGFTILFTTMAWTFISYFL